MAALTTVVFDVGNVLFHWDPERLYRELIADEARRAHFLANVCSFDWHNQHDEGRDFADTSAELIAEHPQFADEIRSWGARFNETLGGFVPGMEAIVRALEAAGVPLYAITNFSHEFWPPFRAEQPIFDAFRDILVSGEEKLAKPDPAIFARAIARFGIEPTASLFIDDRADNVAAAEAAGMRGHVFRDAATLRVLLLDEGLLPR